MGRKEREIGLNKDDVACLGYEESEELYLEFVVLEGILNMKR